MQSVIMFAGVIITLSYVWIATGEGPAQWWSIAGGAHQQHTSPPLLSFDVTVRVTILTAMLHSFFWIVCTHGSDQMVVQRYFTTTSLKAALRSYLISACSDVTVAVLLAMSGLALFAFYHQHPTFLSPEIAPIQSADKWFPYFIAHQLPPGLGGLILAALFAAGMSSVSSGINSVSAVAVTDIVSRFSRGSGHDADGLARARWLSLAIGVLVTVLATGFARLAEKPSDAEFHREEEVVLEQAGKLAEEEDAPPVAAHAQNIMELMAKGFNMFLGPLAALFFIGMFLPRSTSRSAIPAVLCGLAVSIVWSYWHELGLPQLLDGIMPAGEGFKAIGFDRLVGPKAGVPTFTLAISLPCVITVLTAFALSWFIEDGREHAGRQWTWYAVMRRPVPPPTVASK
jgi:Na+/proline symporter